VTSNPSGGSMTVGTISNEPAEASS
jgi:hypothetical protein